MGKVVIVASGAGRVGSVFVAAAMEYSAARTVAKLQQGATAAATTLLKVMLDQTTPGSVRVRSAECVMNHSSQAIEIEDIEARVSELERAADTSASPRGEVADQSAW